MRRVPNVLRRRTAVRLARAGFALPGVAAWAESELVGRLIRAASAERADLYVGHYLPGLYVAYRAAHRHSAAYGFDVEDSHVDELPVGSEYAGRRATRERLERRLLPGCRHLTASSPLIAETYHCRYAVDPLVVLNVFPLSDAPPVPVETEYQRGCGPPTLYWFSQTVGPGRGLEPVVRALGRMQRPAVLHLRGIPAAGYRASLDELATNAGAAGRIVWLSPAAPGDMACLAAQHDLGLALELCDPWNRAICLTNKAFTYLLAGVPAVLSRTPAQDQLAGELGSAAVTVDLMNPAGLAATFDAILAPESLARMRSAAWQAGRGRYNWDCEREVFLTSVDRALKVGH